MFVKYKADFLFLDWTSWSACSRKCHIGTRTRSRSITQHARWGGDCPYDLNELDVCGAANGGCQQNCNPNTGHCSCLAGYTPSGTLKNYFLRLSEKVQKITHVTNYARLPFSSHAVRKKAFNCYSAKIMLGISLD